MGAAADGAWRRLRAQTDLLLEPGASNSFAARSVHLALAVAVFISVAAMILKSVPHIDAQWRKPFLVIEISAVALFTIEYVLRLWSAPEQKIYHGMNEGRARWLYATSAFGLIDLLSVAPLYVMLFVEPDFTALLLFRLLRYFKLARYSAGMSSLLAALQLERRALAASLVLLLGAMIVWASIMYIVEGRAQPEKFGTIPDAMWWALVTLTTVGYGDVVPVTAAGKIVAALTMITGFMMLALPVGIIATAFAEQIHRREFVVNWGMLARVPLFSSLTAQEIADLMQYLRAQSLPAGGMVFRKGDPAECLYFIADGEIEIDLPSGLMLLGEGDFFGEISLMKGLPRSGHARAVRPAKLLILATSDLFALMDKNPDIRQRIEQAAALRGAVAPEPPLS